VERASVPIPSFGTTLDGLAAETTLANHGAARNNRNTRVHAFVDPPIMSQAGIIPIIGGGPAGMSCALWLHNYELRPISIEREAVIGGMARRSPYPNEGLLGRPGESARENADAFVHHLRKICVETWIGARPEQLRSGDDGCFRLDVALSGTDSSSSSAIRSLSSAAIVIATGTKFHGDDWLDRVANARRMAERGRLHVGAPWAGERGADLGAHVAVLGGGDNAFDVARMLVEKGVRVTVIMRSQAPKAQPLMVQRLCEHHSSGMAQVLARRTVRALDDVNSRVRLRLDDGDHIDADHVLLLFGYRPNSAESWMAELALERDSRGYVVVDGNMETSCPGAFAVGDVANPIHPCIATAIATGTMAAREIGKRLTTAAKRMTSNDLR
jgi:thioredoxin reductase (NADPH)